MVYFCIQYHSYTIFQDAYKKICFLATMKAILAGMHGLLYIKNNLETLEHHYLGSSTFDT